MEFKLKRYNVTFDADYGQVTIPFDDAEFLGRYYAMLEDCERFISQQNERIREIDKDDLRGHLTVTSETGRYIAEAIDTAIGEGTCKAVFGDYIPTPDMCVQFLNWLNDVPVAEYAKSRKEFTSKYSPERMGGAE